jgi:hypothetical protein
MSSSPFVTTPLFTPEDYEVYAQLMNVPVSVFAKDIIGITSVNDSHGFTLANFHYHPDLVDKLTKVGPGGSRTRYEYTPEEIFCIEQVRGVTVDLETKTIVCLAPGRTRTCMRSTVPEDGSFDFMGPNFDYMGNPTITDAVYKIWAYGALIRCFSYKGHVFMSTPKKISCENSRFEGSRTFMEMFFSHQTVFPTAESIFENGNVDTLVHLFIIHDEDLVFDAPEFDYASVYYLGSYQISNPGLGSDGTNAMTAFITEKNRTAEKPIRFNEIISPAEANRFLGGESEYGINPNSTTREVSAEIAMDFRENALRMFERSGRVFMICQVGSFAVSPPAAVFRTKFMAGKGNVPYTFAECMAQKANDTLTDDKIFVDHGFTYEQLKTMEPRLARGLPIDFAEYPNMEPSFVEKLLTNVVFACQPNKVNDAFMAYESFPFEVLRAVEYLFGMQDVFKNAIFKNTLEEIPGLKTGSVNLKRYMKSTFCGCIFEKPGRPGQKSIPDMLKNGPRDYWPQDLIDSFNGNASAYAKSQNRDYRIRNALTVFIMQAPHDVIYGLLHLEDKITKAKVAEQTRRAREIEEATGVTPKVTFSDKVKRSSSPSRSQRPPLPETRSRRSEEQSRRSETTLTVQAQKVDRPKGVRYPKTKKPY